MIETNRYITSRLVFSDFIVYVADLKVDEKAAIQILHKDKENTPFTVHDGKVYFTSIKFSETSTFTSISKGKMKSISLLINSSHGCRIIRNLTYKAIRNMLTNNGYSQIRSGSRRIFYISDDTNFVLTRNINSTEIRAVRGFNPRINCNWYNKQLEICFVEDGVHRATVPEESWDQWIGFKVRVEKNIVSSDLRGGVELVAVDGLNKTVRVKKNDEFHDVSIDRIKLVVDSSTLFRLNILNLFRGFNSYEYRSAKSLRKAIYDFNRDIAPNGWFDIQYDPNRRQVIKFTNLPP